jgi:hypothetical protein
LPAHALEFVANLIGSGLGALCTRVLGLRALA